MDTLNRDTIKEIVKAVNGTEHLFKITDTVERDDIVLGWSGQALCHCA